MPQQAKPRESTRITDEGLEPLAVPERERIDPSRLADCFHISSPQFRYGGGTSRQSPGFINAASIFVVIEDELGNPAAVKLGWGDFEPAETGPKGMGAGSLKDMGTVFVLDQRRGYFLDKAAVDELETDPVKFLTKRASYAVRGEEVLINVPPGEESFEASRAASLTDRFYPEYRAADLTAPEFSETLRPLPARELLTALRNKALAVVGPERIEQFIDAFPAELGEAQKEGYRLSRVYSSWLMSDSRERLESPDTRLARTFESLKSMGIETVGISVGDERATRSLLDLLSSYNRSERRFE